MTADQVIRLTIAALEILAAFWPGGGGGTKVG